MVCDHHNLTNNSTQPYCDLLYIVMVYFSPMLSGISDMTLDMFVRVIRIRNKRVTTDIDRTWSACRITQSSNRSPTHIYFIDNPQQLLATLRRETTTTNIKYCRRRRRRI